MESQKSNVVVFAERIASAQIPDEIKLQALNDILKMLNDRGYASQVNFIKFYKPPFNLHETMIWISTSHGDDFWSRMDTLISDEPLRP